MTYTIRTKQQTIATVATYGEALDLYRADPTTTGRAIFWGKGKTRSSMNFREWGLIADHAVRRLEASGKSAALLLANTGA